MSGRIRTIKPELLEDAVTAGLSDTAFRLFVGMILLSDDYGVLRAEVAYLNGQIHWRRPPAIPLAEALNELTAKLVRTWDHGGQTYAFICNWEKHQKVAHRGKRRLPEPPESLVNSSRDPHEDLTPDQRPATSDQRPATSDQRPTDTGQAPPDPTSQVLRIADTKAPRRQRARAAKTTIPSDWKPTDATVDEYRAQGVDAMACVREFRNYWIGEGEAKANWEATFCNRVDALVSQGRAPKLRPKLPPRRDEPLDEAPASTSAGGLSEDLFTSIGKVLP